MAWPILGTCPTIHSGEKAILWPIEGRVEGAAKGNSGTSLAISMHWTNLNFFLKDARIEEHYTPHLPDLYVQNISLISAVQPKHARIHCWSEYSRMYSHSQLLSSCKHQIQSQHSPTCCLQAWVASMAVKGCQTQALPNSKQSSSKYLMCNAMWLALIWFLRLHLYCLHVLSQCGVSPSNVCSPASSNDCNCILKSQWWRALMWFTNFTLVIEIWSCIRCMFCLSVACTTFHCPSPPIPSHFPALHIAYCTLYTAPQCILHTWFILSTVYLVLTHCTSLHTALCETRLRIGD